MSDEKPSLEELAHHGVKGMRWGHHKTPKPTTADIHAARNRHNERISQLNQLDRKAYASTQAERRKLAQKAKAIAEEGLKSGDLSIAGRATTGEKVVAALLAGPVGVLVVRARARSQAATGRRVLKDFQRSPDYVG